MCSSFVHLLYVVGCKKSHLKGIFALYHLSWCFWEHTSMQKRSNHLDALLTTSAPYKCSMWPYCGCLHSLDNDYLAFFMFILNFMPDFHIETVSIVYIQTIMVLLNMYPEHSEWDSFETARHWWNEIPIFILSFAVRMTLNSRPNATLLKAFIMIIFCVCHNLIDFHFGFGQFGLYYPYTKIESTSLGASTISAFAIFFQK